MIDSDENRAAETEAAYDAVADDYALRTATRSSDVDRFVSRFVAELGSRSVVVDLGCGPGEDLRRLAQKGHRPIGVDRSAELLALAPGCKRIRADIGHLPLADSSVDAAWSYASLLHVEPDALEHTLREWERVLLPRGVVGLSTSLGGDHGWELAPASGPRVPKMKDGARRWFVHHEEKALTDAMLRRNWDLLEVSVRSSHRDWLQVIARTPDPTSSALLH